jgi:hypothetical protein
MREKPVTTFFELSQFAQVSAFNTFNRFREVLEGKLSGVPMLAKYWVKLSLQSGRGGAAATLLRTDKPGVCLPWLTDHRQAGVSRPWGGDGFVCSERVVNYNSLFINMLQTQKSQKPAVTVSQCLFFRCPCEIAFSCCG